MFHKIFDIYSTPSNAKNKNENVKKKIIFERCQKIFLFEIKVALKEFFLLHKMSIIWSARLTFQNGAYYKKYQ